MSCLSLATSIPISTPIILFFLPTNLLLQADSSGKIFNLIKMRCLILSCFQALEEWTESSFSGFFFEVFFSPLPFLLAGSVVLLPLLYDILGEEGGLLGHVPIFLDGGGVEGGDVILCTLISGDRTSESDLS